MEPKVRLKPNVYILLAGILLLALLMQMSRSESLFGSIRNEAVAGGMSGWKPAVPDDDVLRPSGRPYCVAYDGSREESVKIKRQLERTLGYMKNRRRRRTCGKDGLTSRLARRSSSPRKISNCSEIRRRLAPMPKPGAMSCWRFAPS
nr:hypothetical protein [Paenibacillus cisolokensis]